MEKYLAAILLSKLIIITRLHRAKFFDHMLYRKYYTFLSFSRIDFQVVLITHYFIIPRRRITSINLP